jgi:hypothetical protein
MSKLKYRATPLMLAVIGALAATGGSFKIK